MSNGITQESLELATEYQKQKKDEDTKERDIEKEAVGILEVLTSGGGDINACISALFEILKITKAKYNDEDVANNGLNEAIPFADLEPLLGFYMANFIISS